MGRNDALRWGKKVDRILQATLHPEKPPEKAFDPDYHQKVLEKIARRHETV